MREIKFKAKYKNEWVFFTIEDLVNINRESMTDEDYKILNHDLNTRCQFIDRVDIKGNEIYENDIVDDNAVVQWFAGLTWDGGCVHPGFYCKKWFDYEEGEMSFHDNFKNVEVIGNTYDV